MLVRLWLRGTCGREESGHEDRVQNVVLLRCTAVRRRSAASEESVAAAVELGVAEDGLDRGLAAGVELAARIAGQDAAHEAVEAALPARPRRCACSASGGTRTCRPSAMRR